MVGRHWPFFPFGFWPIFRGELLGFRECNLDNIVYVHSLHSADPCHPVPCSGHEMRGHYAGWKGYGGGPGRVPILFIVFSGVIESPIMGGIKLHSPIVGGIKLHSPIVGGSNFMQMSLIFE